MVGEPFIIHQICRPTAPTGSSREKFVPGYKEKFKVEPPIMAAHLADCTTLLEMAIPAGLKRGQPGTQEFKDGIRDALENVKGLYLNNGLLTNSPTEHAGYDPSGQFVMTVQGRGVPSGEVSERPARDVAILRDAWPCGHALSGMQAR